MALGKPTTIHYQLPMKEVDFFMWIIFEVFLSFSISLPFTFGPLFFVPTLPLLLVCKVAITISLCTKKLVNCHSTPHFHTIVHNYGTYIIFVSPWTLVNIVLFNGLVVTTYLTHHCSIVQCHSTLLNNV